MTTADLAFDANTTVSPPPSHLVRDLRYKLTGMGLKQLFRLRWTMLQRPASTLAIVAGIGLGVGYLAALTIHRD